MKKIFCVSLFSLFFFSCSQAPLSINNQLLYQKNLQAAQHWQILARDFANQTGTLFEQGMFNFADNSGMGHVTEEEINTSAKTGSLGTPYIYIQTNDLSSFGKAFRNELINEFTNMGYNIAYDPNDAITIRWSVNKIHHNTSRHANSVPLTKSAMAVLGYGVYKLIDTGPALGAVVTGAAFLDVLENLGPSTFFGKNVPHDEIVLTLSVSKDGYLLARQSGTYYINGADTGHYSNIADFEGQNEMLLPSKNFKVVNAQ